MELTFEVRRNRHADPAAEDGGELLAVRAVDVEGLESPRQLETPLYIELHLRVATDEAVVPDDALPVRQAPVEADGAAKPEGPQRKSEEAAAVQQVGAKPVAEASEAIPQADVTQQGANPPVLETSDVEGAKKIPAAPTPVRNPPDFAPLPKAQSVEEFRAQVEKAVTAMPFLPLSPAPHMGGGGLGFNESKVTHVEEPPAYAPRPTPDNPVPKPIWEVDRAAYKKLEDHNPPKLVASPRGTMPELGDAFKEIRDPLKMDALRELAKTQKASIALPVSSAAVQTPTTDTQAREELKKLYGEMMGEGAEKLEKKAPKHKEPPEILRHHEEIDPTEYLKGEKDGKKEVRADVDAAEAAKVWARLLTEPDEVAKATLGNIREGMYPKQVVERTFLDPRLGEKSVLPELSKELSEQYRAIAEASVGSKEVLDKAIAERRAELQREAEERLAQIQGRTLNSANLVCRAQGEEESKIDARAEAVEKRSAKVKAAAAKAKPPETVPQKRDRLLQSVQQKVATAQTRFSAMADQRKGSTDGSQSKHEAAYEYTQQKDELSILASTAGGPEREDALKKSTDWLKQVKAETTKAFDEFRKLDGVAMASFQDGVSSASTVAYRAIRTWADTQQGVVKTDVQRQAEATQDREAAAVMTARSQKQLNAEKLAKSANAEFQILGAAKTAAKDQTKKEALLAGKDISAEQRQVAAAILLTNGDPYELIAARIRKRSAGENAGKYFARLKQEIFDSGDWQKIAEVGYAVAGDSAGATVETRALAIRNAANGYTSNDDVETILKNLDGLNEFTVEALYERYQKAYGVNLWDDIEDDMDGPVHKGRRELAYVKIQRACKMVYRGEPQFAQQQKKDKNDPANDDNSPYAKTEETERLRLKIVAAEIYRYGRGQWGTNEEGMFTILRTLNNPAECKMLEEIYQQEYGHALRDDLKGELNDWASRTAHDWKRAEALLDLQKAKADAIAIDQELHYDQWGSADRDDIEKIYSTVEDEVRQEARKNHKDSIWVREEMQKRLAAITTEYAALDKDESLPLYVHSNPSDPNSPMIRAKRGTLQASYKTVFGDTEGEILVAESNYDKERADTYRLMNEKKGLWVSDSESNKVFMAQQERARKNAELDHEPALRYYAREAMRIEEDRHFRSTGKFWTMKERYERTQKSEHQISRRIDDIAGGDAALAMKGLDAAYRQASGGQTLLEYIDKGMSGYDAKYARIMATTGYLDPYERLEFSVMGVGTNEELLKSTLKTLSKDDINQIETRWQREHGQTLKYRLEDELSGDDYIEAQVAYEGKPMTMDDAIGVARLREELSRPGAAGARAAKRSGAGDVNEVATLAIDRLEGLKRDMESAGYDNLTPEEQEGWIAQFDSGREMVDLAIETRNQVVSDVTEAVVNAVAMAVAVVVGLALAPFTAGASAAIAVAVIASLAATATSIILRRAMLGGRYGAGEIGMDLAMGVVDAVVAALTAGMGNSLLGIRQAAVKAAEQQAEQVGKRVIIKAFLSRFGNVGKLAKGVSAVPWLEKMAAKEASLLSKAIAHGIAISAENIVQSVPSAIIANVANEENWKNGNPLTNIASGVGQQVGMGVAQGLAFSVGHHLVGSAMSKAWSLAKGPKLGTETYKSFSREMTPQEHAANLVEHERLHPGQGKAEFEAQVAKERAAVDLEAGEQQKARREVIRELNEELGRTDPARRGEFNDVPITELSRVDYLRKVGIGAPDVVVIVENGQVHIVMREGANPAHIAQHAAEIAKKVEAGTGGRLNETFLRAALPESLKGKVVIRVEPGLERFEIKVKRSVPPEILVGPGVSAKSFQNHLRVAKNVLSLQGARGTLAKLLEQASFWVRLHGVPPEDSVAFLAHQEVRKLPREIEFLERQLTNPDLEPGHAARLEEQLASAHAQLEFHRTQLKIFDEVPGEGFIAMASARLSRALEDEFVKKLGIQHPDDPTKVVHPLNFEQLGPPPPRLAEDSPLAEIHGTRVFEVGPRKGSLRLLAVVDENGKVIEAYMERWVTKTVPGGKTSFWRARGAEPAYRGALTEHASKAWDLQQLAERRANGSPADFIVEVQNAHGHGFDRVLVTFDPVKDYVNGVLRKDAVPTIVLVEDKSSAVVQAGEISAIGPRLKKNIDALKIGAVPVKDLAGTPVALSAKVLEPSGAVGIKDEHVAHIKNGLEKGRVDVELRVLKGKALKGGTAGEDFRDANIVQKVLKDMQDSNVLQGVQEIRVSGVELSTKAKEFYEQAFKQYTLERRLGESFPLHDRAKIMAKTSGQTSFGVADYQAAFYAERFPPGGRPKAEFVSKAYAVDGVRLLRDGTEAFLHVGSQPPGAKTPQHAKFMGDLAAIMLEEVAHPPKGASKLSVVLNAEGWTPKNDIDALKLALEHEAGKHGKAGIERLGSIFTYGVKKNGQNPLFTAKELDALRQGKKSAQKLPAPKGGKAKK